MSEFDELALEWVVQSIFVYLLKAKQHIIQNKYWTINNIKKAVTKNG